TRRDPDGEETYRVLRRAVERHLMSERPLGVYLSGGLDSSAIVALMSDLGIRNIRTYSVGCQGYDQNEFENARAVAEHFKTNHTEVELSAEDFTRALAVTASHADEPMADLTSIPLYELSAVARRDVTVVLSGEGSDEFWAGYGGMEHIAHHFRLLEQARPFRGVARMLAHLAPRRFAKTLRTLTLSPSQYLQREVWNCSNALSADQARQFFFRYPPEFDVYGDMRRFYRERPDWAGLDLALGAQIEWWLPDDLLHKADRMSMANSIELRCPFLDREFTDYCASLCNTDKVNSRDRKYTRKIALKKAFEHRLPAGIANQPKKGFPIATNGWLQQELRGYMREQLLGGTSFLPQNFDRGFLETIDQDSANGDRSAQVTAWALIVLNTWATHWLAAQRVAA
ncbi:MAG: asparagine synthase C-terminal domain-containing protein, partial [Bryobacterales bacterium]|nr:asparagine synthase C-terminal domain-containing protein [Bryobacterales bacterium]